MNFYSDPATPRSPSLSHGYEFKTFRSNESYEEDDDEEEY